MKGRERTNNHLVASQEWAITAIIKQIRRNVHSINSSSADITIFWDSYAKITTADALAPFVARTPAVMLLTIQDKQTFFINEDEFQQLVPA